MSEQSFSGLVFLWRSNCVGVILIVHLQNFISHLDSADTFFITVTINVFEQLEVELLVFQNFVIVEAATRLAFVELVFKDRNLIVKSLEFVIKSSLALSIFCLFLLLFVSRSLCRAIFALDGRFLSLCLLLHNRIFSRLLVELASHEVLVSVQIFI